MPDLKCPEKYFLHFILLIPQFRHPSIARGVDLAHICAVSVVAYLFYQPTPLYEKDSHPVMHFCINGIYSSQGK